MFVAKSSYSWSELCHSLPIRNSGYEWKGRGAVVSVGRVEIGIMINKSNLMAEVFIGQNCLK